VLLDTDMPRMDGYEVVRHLKADEATRPVPIILITSSPAGRERSRVPVLGTEACRYVSKPLSIELLIREIKKAIVDGQ
jgi:chemosensory pili system protein ChpA (sensor histidine kinase/response regulator)